MVPPLLDPRIRLVLAIFYFYRLFASCSVVSFQHRCTFSTLQNQRVKSVEICRETLPEYDIPHVYPAASNMPDEYDMEAGRGNI